MVPKEFSDGETPTSHKMRECVLQYHCRLALYHITAESDDQTVAIQNWAKL